MNLGPRTIQIERTDVATAAPVTVSTGVRPLPGSWRSNPGDNPTWSSPAFDDSAWPQNGPPQRRRAIANAAITLGQDDDITILSLALAPAAERELASVHSRVNCRRAPGSPVVDNEWLITRLTGLNVIV